MKPHGAALSASVAAFRKDLAAEGYEFTPDEALSLLKRLGSRVTYAGPGTYSSCGRIHRRVYATADWAAPLCPDCLVDRPMARPA